MSTYNLCFRAKIRKNVYPCTPQFYYIKAGCKEVYISQTCLHDFQAFDAIMMCMCCCVVYTLQEKRQLSLE